MEDQIISEYHVFLKKKYTEYIQKQEISTEKTKDLSSISLTPSVMHESKEQMARFLQSKYVAFK